MRAAWLTDIHLNFVDAQRAADLCRSIDATGADAVLIGGDIAEAHDLGRWLEFMAARLERPVYFVLGNHDYYGSSIAPVRAAIRALCGTSPHLHWLAAGGVIELTPSSALIGHGGWGDGRHGDYERSDVPLMDFVAIDDLSRFGPDKAARRRRLEELGDEAARHFRDVLPAALAAHRHVFALTHVPPFREACWYDGAISDDDYLPHFSCKAVGDVMTAIMRQHPEHRLTVFCGHTHGSGLADPLPNLHVKTGAARYGHPVVQQVIDIP